MKIPSQLYALLLILTLLIAACAAPAVEAPAAPEAVSAPEAEAEVADAEADADAEVADADTEADAEVADADADADAEVAAEDGGAGHASLVSTDWLAENLENPAVRLIEVSVIPGVYERGHIPGAVNFRWHTDLMDPTVRDITSPEAFEQLAQSAGINQDSTVILYGDNSNWFAAWGVWVFKIYGAEDVRILDGGRAKWEAEGRELAVTPPSPAAGDFTVGAVNDGLRALLPDVLEVVEGQVEADLIDIRSPAEFEGTIFAPEGMQELSVRAGHIPGAVNVPWSQAVAEDGTFKSQDELRALYAAVGVDGSRPIIVYCRIGERASHTWFLLSELLGYEVALYDGSWTDWGNTVGVP
ncbi:MAG: sulfurtransferase, partial [Litorilinea sp.]